LAEPFKNIEKEILDYCHSTFVSSDDYYHNFTIEELKRDNMFNEINEEEISYWINHLKKKRYLEIRTSSEGRAFCLSLEGILFLEKIYIKKEQVFTSLTTDVLDFLKRVQERTISMYPSEGRQVGFIPVSEFFDNIGITEEEEKKKIGFVIYEITKFTEGENFIYSNSFVPDGRNLNFYRTSFLTTKGRGFLNYHLKLRNLFFNHTDKFAKEILLEEYNEIELLRKRERWKDCFIKIGSILEYLITNYFEENKSYKDENGKLRKFKIFLRGKTKEITPSEAKFGDQLSFIKQNEVFGKVYNNDWNMVDGLIRNFRNNIHLQKYFRDNVRINKNTFDQLYPVFERLIQLF